MADEPTTTLPAAERQTEWSAEYYRGAAAECYLESSRALKAVQSLASRHEQLRMAAHQIEQAQKREAELLVEIAELLAELVEANDRAENAEEQIDALKAWFQVKVNNSAPTETA